MALVPATPQPRSRPSVRAVVLVLLAWHPGLAEGPSLAPTGPALPDDPLLASLIGQALEQRPEVAQARAVAQAVAQQAPQVGALPDPIVSLGIQNDSFRKIQIGKMETSYLSVMGSQTFPWRGKRTLRSAAFALAHGQAEADLDRVRLSVQAEVERAYVNLLLTRDQLALLRRLEALWTQAEGLARGRYEAGEGAQSGLLRAQLERTRLQQRRIALAAEEERRVAALDRLCGRPLDGPIATDRSLASLPDPVLPDLGRAAADAEARSPELQRAGLGVEQSARLVELARKDYLPDLTVSAALMPRWGPFGPMWQAGLSFSVPLWVGSKQSRAVTENQLRGAAAESGAQAVRQLLGQRVKERLTALAALLESNRLYRSALLIQSEATVSSTLVQYRVGQVTFASVLEALTGYLGDLNGFYESVAATQRVDIAGREVSLEPAAGPGTSGMGGSPVPGAGAIGSGPAAGGGSTSPM